MYLLDDSITYECALDPGERGSLHGRYLPRPEFIFCPVRHCIGSGTPGHGSSLQWNLRSGTDKLTVNRIDCTVDGGRWSKNCSNDVRQQSAAAANSTPTRRSGS